MSDSRNRLLTRVVAPEDEPLTLADAKTYLRITHDDEDMLISDLIIAVRMTAEQWLKRSLMTQSWKLAYDDYIDDCVILPMGPVDSVTSVIIVSRDTTTQEVDSGIYYLNAAQDTLIFDAALVGFRIEITYVAGYGNADAVPQPIKQGMLAHIAALYDRRGEVEGGALPPYTAALYMPYRGVLL